MKSKAFSIVSVIASLSASAWAQSPTRLVQLPIDPPKETLTSLSMGQLSADYPLHLSLSLPYRDAEGLEKFVGQVSDPKSPMYRQFLTPDKVGARFGLPQSTFDRVVAYLTANGMKIRHLSPTHLAILFDATAAQASAAFHTSVEAFASADPRYAGDVPLYSFTVPPSVPAEIAPYVVHIGGLETFSRPVPMGNVISPSQMRQFYNSAPMYNLGNQGQGRTIGVTSFDGYSLTSLSVTYPAWGLPSPSGGIGSNVSVEVASGDKTGKNQKGTGEGDLDIQNVLNIAPLSHVIVYDSYNSYDEIGVNTLELDDNTADIITESYGIGATASYYAANHNLFASMAADGITYMCASGDNGSTLKWPYPDADPMVLTVGGTTTNTNSSGSLLSQTGWSGSGGGWYVSNDAFNKLSSWQVGKGVPTNVPYRLIPDVALDADTNTPNQFYLEQVVTGAPGNWQLLGGTSCASPEFAGGLAVAEEEAIATGGLSADAHGHRRLGLIAPLLYIFNSDSRLFTDITSGSNGKLPNGSTSNCTPGWDFVTGLGVINFTGLAALTSPIQVSSVSLSTTSVEGSGTASVTGKVTLNSKAPSGGLPISLSSSNINVTVPSSVVVPAGSLTATFAVTANVVSSSVTSTISSTFGGWTVKTATLTDTPIHLTKLTVNPTSVVGGNSSTGTVTLGAPAPSGGLKVALSAFYYNVTKVPPTVTIPAGQSSVTFTITTIKVSQTYASAITATANGASVSATLTVKP